jgi:hypothetical protein
MAPHRVAVLTFARSPGVVEVTGHHPHRQTGAARRAAGPLDPCRFRPARATIQ